MKLALVRTKEEVPAIVRAVCFFLGINVDALVAFTINFAETYPAADADQYWDALVMWMHRTYPHLHWMTSKHIVSIRKQLQ